VKVTADDLTTDRLKVFRRAVRREMEELHNLYRDLSDLIDFEGKLSDLQSLEETRVRVVAAWNAREGCGS